LDASQDLAAVRDQYFLENFRPSGGTQINTWIGAGFKP
jgi:hypothetical protein